MSVADSGRQNPTRMPGSAKSWSELLDSSALWEHFQNAAGMGMLFARAAREAVKPPFPWIRETAVELSLVFRRCSLPLSAAIVTFMIGFGFFVLGGITVVLGASDREGGAVIIGFQREAAIWITGMVFAGVAGSAMAADLGARKVRDELDALSVLGVDQIRALVVPKLIAGMIAAPVLGMVSMVAIEGSNFAFAPSQFGYSPGVLFAATQGSLISLDIFGALIRYVLIGAFVAIVSCYKGLSSKGGTMGVGRAVNETIVLTFFFVWGLDAFFNLAYLSLFPQAQVDFKG